MSYTVILSKKAEKIMSKIDIGYYKKIENIISQLSNWPNVAENLDIKKLMNVEASYRIRAGTYRIIYCI